MALEARGVRTGADGPSVSVRVGRGEVVALAAPDGETAMLDAFLEVVLAGAAVVAGTVLVDGVEVAAAGRSQPAGVVRLGDLDLPSGATPTDVLSLYAAAGIDEALAATGLTADAGTPVTDLAPDARRRLELARALVSDAALIAGRDPRTGLDDDGARAFAEAAAGVARRGLAVLLVVEDPDAGVPGGRTVVVGEDADADAPGGATGDPVAQRVVLLKLALRGLDRAAAADELRRRTGEQADPAVLADVFGRVERLEAEATP